MITEKAWGFCLGFGVQGLLGLSVLKLLGVVDLVIRITCQQLNARIRGTGFEVRISISSLTYGVSSGYMGII